MTAQALKSPRRWLWRALWLIGAALALIALTIGVAVVMLKGQYGAALVRDFADGREIAGYGRLDVGPVRGDVLGRFRIEAVSISDEEGVWLEAEDIQIAWNPWALTGRVVDIDQMEIGAVRVARRPQRAAREAAEGGAPVDLTRWRLDLETARIAALSLADGVAGPHADLALSASLTRIAGAWRGGLSAERLDAPGDRITLDFQFAETLQASYEITAAPDGPMTALLGMPGASIAGEGTLSGDLLEGEGAARFNVDGRPAVQLDAGWRDQRLLVQGEADLSALPRLESASRRLAGPVRWRAEAPFEAGGLTALSLSESVLEIESGAVQVNLQPGADQTLDLTATLGEGALALLTGDSLTARSARLAGQVELAGNRGFSGRIEAAGFAAPGEVSVEALEGGLTLRGPLSAPDAQWDLQLQAPRLGAAAEIATILGEAPRVQGAAVWRREAGVIDLSDLRIDAAAGTVTGAGALDLAAQRWTLDAASNAFEPGALTDLVAGAGRVSVEAAGGFDGALQAGVQLSGFTPAGALQGRLSAPVSGGAAVLRSADGALEINDIRVESPELRLDAEATREDAGWRLEGDAVWSGAAPVSALTLDGALAARFEAQLGQGDLNARLEARAPALSLGPETIARPRLRVELSGAPATLSGEARLTGEGGRGPIDLAARFERAEEVVRLTAMEGRAAGFTLEGSGEAGPDAMSVNALLRPEGGFGRLNVAAAMGPDGVQADLRAEDLVFADLSYIDSAQLTLSGPLDGADLSFSAAGAYGAAFEVSGEGQAALAGEARGVSTTLDGRYGAVMLATRAPISLRLAPSLSLEADLTLGQGRGRLAYSDGTEPRLEASLEDAPAALLSLRRAREPVEGLLSGAALLTRTDGVWTGEVSLSGADLRPARSAEDRTLSGGVSAVLDRERLDVRATASGAALSAEAELSVETGPVAQLSQLTDPNASLIGQARAEGRIGDFAAFHIDPAQRLSGAVDLDAEISGVVSDPVVTGSARLSDGRFSDGRAGLDLQALEAELDLTRAGGRLTRLSASDGQGGRLSGTGRLDIATPIALEADLSFERFRLVDRRDAEAVATGEVQFVLQDGEGRLSGAAVIDRADLTPNGRGRAAVRQIEVTEINRPAGLEPVQDARSGPPITLDYQVSAPRRVFVRGPNYDTEWGFDLAITGTSSDPVLQGEARLVRGRADLLGRSFDLERGQVILDGDPAQARLQIAAVNQRQDLTARIVVDGTVSDPELRLTSQPALPEDEVASRILFGESAANLTALQAAQLAGALASLSGGSGLDPLGALRQAAGLDLLGVRRNAAGETVVSGGRYLTADVFLQLEGAGAGAAPATRIDWTLNPRLTLTSSLDSRGRAGLALSWRVEYDDDPFDEIRLFRGFRDRLGLGQGGEREGESDGSAP